MEGTRKCNPAFDNPVTKGHTWFVLTDKWILANKKKKPKQNNNNNNNNKTAQNTHNTTHRSYETKERRPKCECFSSIQKEEETTSQELKTGEGEKGGPGSCVEGDEGEKYRGSGNSTEVCSSRWWGTGVSHKKVPDARDPRTPQDPTGMISQNTQQGKENL